MNDKPSDNIPDNMNSNVNSIEVNNSNDIPGIPIYCEYECTICNSLFETNEDKYTSELLTRSNQIATNWYRG